MPLPTREEAWELVCEWIASDSLRKHVLAVEAGVRAYARRFDGDAIVTPIWTIPSTVTLAQPCATSASMTSRLS